MSDLLVSYGLPALFLVSFLAATLVPVGSEWLLVLLLLRGTSPWQVVAVATLGNWLGALTTYLLGVWGSELIIRRWLRISAEGEERGRRFFRRYGSWSLLCSWLPVVGDPLCLVAGLLEITLFRFSLLVFVGKLARYATVAWLTLTVT
ncbi:MAG TPA: YqaA family protein [Geobacterales bacterium]|nr:YqaA family protein [Geobacterales bacterium]